MTKKVEVFRLGADGIPSGLEGRLVVPSHIKQDGHLLKPYVKEELIPSEINLILLEDLSRFWQQQIAKNSSYSYHGVYVNADQKTPLSKKERQALSREYGIWVERAILLPAERINYWTLIHESLHDVFHYMPPERKAEMLSSARKSYNTQKKLYELFYATSVSTCARDFHHLFKKDSNRKIFNALREKWQVRAIDEFISYLFTSPSYWVLWKENCLPRQFRSTLRRVGYNTYNPPKNIIA